MADQATATSSDISKIANSEPENIPAPAAAAATDWFLSDDETTGSTAAQPIELNVGGPVGTGREKWVEFIVQPIEREELKRIRKQNTKPGANNTEEVDEMAANLRITVEGLVSPNLKGDKRMRKVRGTEYLDPADALAARFAHKPGLIDQLAGKIIEVSGYSDGDIRDVKAAGN